MARLVLLAVLPLLLLFVAGDSYATAAGGGGGGGGRRFDASRAVDVSWRPRAFLYEGFLSDAECDHLISLAKQGKMEKSTVVDGESGESVTSKVRTSSGMFLDKKQDEVVARIEERIAAWTMLPTECIIFYCFANFAILKLSENGESMQILRYGQGEKYEPHFDYISGRQGSTREGDRVATVLMYLSNVKMGGETIFPDCEARLSQPKDETWSDCAEQGFAVKPAKGSAVLFFSLHPNATLDTDSLHGSCPVIEGEKWSATKWIHVRSYSYRRRSAGKCEDEHVLCSSWAAAGECAKNPGYMVGTSDSPPGFCRKSCNAGGARLCRRRRRTGMARLVLLVALLLLLSVTGETSATGGGGEGGRFDASRAVDVSWSPRVFLYEGFLSDAECEHLIALAKQGRMERSTVVNGKSGESVMSKTRTSSGMFLIRKQDEVVARIEERIAAWTMFPAENGESMQMLRYGQGEKYEPHFDYIRGRQASARGGHRIATVLMYLSNVKMGGETVFPDAEARLSQPKDETWSDCAEQGFAVKPTKGSAVLFFSLYPNATFDPGSLHGSCPVIQGEKWSATKWIHVRSYDENGRRSSDKCEDEHALCSSWAAAGECAKNPGYMVGTSESPGFCRKSCNVCTS
uniref:procollagen-proline 4-dioxygenase n=2 Tax=Oryza TaxID=4527 RepID=A0A0E0GHA0_ORYNI